MLRSSLALALLLATAPMVLDAQQNTTVQQAQTAYDQLRYGDAITLVRRAIRERLTQADQVTAYEILAFAYAALDSTAQAIEGFKQLIFLDPNREPDVEAVAPRIVNAYTSALGDVLVVRRVDVDSASFIAGQGSVPIRFEVSRPSRAVARVLGPGFDAVIDSFLVGRQGLVEWRAVDAEAAPVPPGTYQLVINAFERDNQHGAQVDIVVRHAPVDTIPHLLTLPGQSELPEMEAPPRDWQPLGLAVLYAGLGAGAALALESEVLGGGGQTAVFSVTLGSAMAGLALSLKKPDLRPVQANIRYNRLIRDELTRRNADIAQQNTDRRRQILLTVVPGGGTQ
ncbi:MAG TPA: tetratricopeptide repeat protein [Gemmatimonadales bacterium]